MNRKKEGELTKTILKTSGDESQSVVCITHESQQKMFQLYLNYLDTIIA